VAGPALHPGVGMLRVAEEHKVRYFVYEA